jgi:hypothetical protein
MAIADRQMWFDRLHTIMSFRTLLLAIFLVASGMAQVQVGKQVGNPSVSGRGGSQKGTFRVIVEPASSSNSLEDLSRESPLIVEGTVDTSNFPTRQPDPGNPQRMETDVVFLVSKILKGDLSPQKTFPRVVISQTGGTVGQLTIETDEPRLAQGEHDILFLQPDARPNLKNIAGLPRYIVVGVWFGKFRVERNNTITVPARSPGGLRSHHQEDHDAFLGKVMAAIAKSK